MNERKYYTVKEWKKFKNNNYFDMQEMLCKQYEIILTNYKTKREKIFSLLSNFPLATFNMSSLRSVATMRTS